VSYSKEISVEHLINKELTALIGKYERLYNGCKKKRDRMLRMSSKTLFDLQFETGMLNGKLSTYGDFLHDLSALKIKGENQ